MKSATVTKPAAMGKKSAKTMVPPDTSGTYLTTREAAYVLNSAGNFLKERATTRS